MTTEQEARKSRNNQIGFGVICTSILIFMSLYLYIVWNEGIASSLIILLMSLFFVKISYDAYATPILYIRQYMSARDNFNKQVIELRKNHKINNRNWLWRAIE